MSAPRVASPEDLRRLHGVRELAAAGAMEALCALLAEPSWAVRREVVAALARAGDAAVPALCELLVTRRGGETV